MVCYVNSVYCYYHVIYFLHLEVAWFIKPSTFHKSGCKTKTLIFLVDVMLEQECSFPNVTDGYSFKFLHSYLVLVSRMILVDVLLLYWVVYDTILLFVGDK